MKKKVGLKNYVKEKLRTATYVVAVASGLSIAAAKNHGTTALVKLLSQDSVWPLPGMSRSVMPNVMVKWMEDSKRRMVFSLWGWNSETAARIQEGLAAKTPEEIAEERAKREAERMIEEAGEGECSYCKESLVKNERGLWESDYLLEYCIDARDHKHKPKIVWKKDG